MSQTFQNLPPIADGGAVVITGAASGIGLAAARRFADLGLPVVLADQSGEKLRAAETSIREAGGRVAAVPTDVSKLSDLERLRNLTHSHFGDVGVLMLNAGTGANPGVTWQNQDAWRALIDVNFWGVLNGVQAFLPAMIENGRAGYVIATGSKQGITTPPGNPAYNVSKAAVKAYTEAMQHELRNTPGCRISAHLLIPGFTFTGMTGGGLVTEKPTAAWSADQVIEFMLESLGRGDFYILCQDNDVSREIDEKRMAWAIGDAIENRPPLSRWHPDWQDRFALFMASQSN